MIRPPRPRVFFDLSRPQASVFNDPARFRVLIAGRRFGKTYLACVEMLTRAAARQNAVCWYVAPTYRQAKEIAWQQLKRMVPVRYLATTPNETDLSLRLVNGSQIALRGAENADSLRGVGVNFLAHDEFALIERAAWDEVLRPALADRGGSALFISTPRGYNWAYDRYMQGQAREHGWSSWQFTTAEGGRVPTEELEAARATMDPRIYRQEFEASFETLRGRVYSNFDRALNVDASLALEGPEILVGLDFNVSPMSCVIAVRAGDECHVLESWELPSSNTEEVAAELHARFKLKRVVVCPDPSGRARKTSAAVGQTDFTILQRYGFSVRAPNAAPAVADRINAVQAMLSSAHGRRRLRIHPKATALVRGLDGLTYKQDTSQPDKSLGLDHITDALGYLIWSEFNLLSSRKLTTIPWRV